jgi:hypothetical protein
MSLQRYQGSLRGVKFGVGEDYEWSEAPAGLGIPAPTFTDAALPAGNTAPGIDRVDKRIIRVPIYVLAEFPKHQSLGTTLGAAVERLTNDLKHAWRPANEITELDLRLGGAARRYFGRTRGLEVDFTNIKSGVVSAVGTFEATEWLAYATSTASVPQATGSTLNVTYTGNAPTGRCILEVVQHGSGKARITNLDDPEQGFILFRQTFSGTIRIGLGQMSITDTSGARRDELISPLSTWFRIHPRNNAQPNRLSLSNCRVGVSAIRYAYY